MQASASALPPTLEPKADSARAEDESNKRDVIHSSQTGSAAGTGSSPVTVETSNGSLSDSASQSRLALDSDSSASALTTKPANGKASGANSLVDNPARANTNATLPASEAAVEQRATVEAESPASMPSADLVKKGPSGQMRSPSPSSVTSEEEGMIKEDEEEEEEGEVPEDGTVTSSAISTSPRRPLAERFSAAPPPVRRWGYAEPRTPVSFDPHPSSSMSSASSRERDHLRSREIDRERERDRGWERPRDKDWDLERERERERDRVRITAPPSRMPVVRAFEEPLVSRLPRGGDSYRPGGATPRPQSGHRTNSGDSINDNGLGRDRDGRDRKSLSPQLPRDRELRDARIDRRDVSSPATPLSGPNSIGPRIAPQVSPAFRDDLERRGAQPIASSIRPWGATPQPSRWNKWGTPRDREGRELFDSRRTGTGDDERFTGRPSDLPIDRTPLRSSAVPEEGMTSRRPLSPPNGSSGSGSQRRSSRSSRSPVADRSARSHSTSNSIANGEPASPTSSRGSKALPRPSAFEPPRSDSGWGPKARKTEASAEPPSASVIPSEDLNPDTTPHVEEQKPLIDAPVALAESELASTSLAEGEKGTSAMDIDKSPSASVPTATPAHEQEKLATTLQEATPMQQLELADLADPREPQRAEDKSTVNAYAAQETIEIAKDKSPIRDSPEPEDTSQRIIPTDASEVVRMAVDEEQLPVDAVQRQPEAATDSTGMADTLTSNVGMTAASPILASTSAAPTLPAEAQIQAGVQGAGPSGMGSLTPAALTRGALTENIKMHVDKAAEGVTAQEEGSYFPTFVSKPLKTEAASSSTNRPATSAEAEASLVMDQSALTYPTAPLVRVSPGPTAPPHLSPKKTKRELTPLVAQKSQEELDEAKRATVRRLLLSGKDLSDDQIAVLVGRNRRLAEHTTFNELESAIHGPPFVKEELVGPVGYVAEAEYNHARTLLKERLGARNKRLEAKAERLRSRYRALDTDWKAHCARLDRAAELRENARKAANQTGTPGGMQQPPQPQPGVEDTPTVSDGHRQSSILGGGSITSGRANRRGTQSGFGFGDAVRSEAEFLEILASLESADMQDPEARAARTATTVPDQLLNPDREVPLQEEWDDRNGFIADPVAFYLDEFDPDHWSEEEKITFARKYAIWPKQFGKIASALPDKTTAQCVYYYYLTKHQPGHDYKAITAARNRNQKRKGKSKPKKGKGSALMADLKRTDEAGEDDEPGSPMDVGQLQSRPSLLGGVDAGLLPLAEEEESFDAQGPSTSKKQRRGVEDGTIDSTDIPTTSAEKPVRSKGGKKGRGQGKSKAASVSFDQASPYPDSPLPTPTAESSIDPDLAAAEALGALSGVVQMPLPPNTVSQAPATASKGKKRKATAGANTEGGADNPGATQRKARPSTSSYWSIQERTEFLRGVVMFGKDWTGVSGLLGAKSAAQARNFFARNVQVPEFIEAAQLGEDNAHLPIAVREQQAADWVRDRIGLLTEDGSVSRGSAVEDTSMEDATPRRGGMGIMSLLNDEAPSDNSTRKKPSLQEWFGDESQGRPGAMPSSEDRIFSSSGVLATDEDDSTDTEDPYAPSQYSSRSSTAVHTPTTYQPPLSSEHRPHLPETMGHPPRPSLTAQRPMPPPSVGSNLGSLPRLTSSASSSTDSQRDSYGDYSRYSRSPAYEIRNQLSPLAPLSSSRTGAVEQAEIPPYARRALYDRGQASVYDRSSASMPPPPLSAGSASSAHRHSWGAPSQASGNGADSRSSHLDYSQSHGHSSAMRSSSAAPYPSESEHQHLASARGSAGPGPNGGRPDYLSPTSSFRPLHSVSSSSSGPPPPIAANDRYYLESSRPSSASASIPPYSSISHGHQGHQGHQGHHQDMSRDRAGDGLNRRPTSSDGRAGLAPSWGSQASHSSHQHHYYQQSGYQQPQQQQQLQGSYAQSSSSRDLPMPPSMSHASASAAAAPPPPPPTLPGSASSRDRERERDGADGRNGSYGSSYRRSGTGS